MLQAYGFMLENNKFNAMNFSAVIDFGQKLGETKEKKDEDEEEEEEDNTIRKQIALKQNKLIDDLLAYIRMSIIEKQEQAKKLKEHILMSTPVDIEFELLVMACTIQLLNSLLKNRFKTTIE